jgi:hypothetical protein
MTEQHPHIDPEIASHSFGPKTSEEIDVVVRNFPDDYAALFRAAIPEIHRRRQQSPAAGEAYKEGVIAALSALAGSESIRVFLSELTVLDQVTFEPPEAA